MEINRGIKNIAILSYIISAVFIGLGFHKLYVYKHSETFIDNNINSYVGGDAYNYIINTGYATSFFVVATLFVIIGSTMVVLIKLNDIFYDDEDNIVEEDIEDEAL